MLKTVLSAHDAAFAAIERNTGWLMPTLARFAFAAVLLVYYVHSAILKTGDGIFGIFQPTSGAYVQIFPRAMEAVGYDSGALGVFHWAVVTAGTVAEYLLPILIVVGLFTRLASIGMIGFIVVQSLTDLFGHGGIAHAKTLGAWFDRLPDGVILDQRLLWVSLLILLVVRGAGPLSLDRLMGR